MLRDFDHHGKLDTQCVSTCPLIQSSFTVHENLSCRLQEVEKNSSPLFCITPGIRGKIFVLFLSCSRSTQESLQHIPEVHWRVSIACSRSTLESPQHVPGVCRRVFSMFQEYEGESPAWLMSMSKVLSFGSCFG